MHASKRTTAFCFMSEAPKGDTTQILHTSNFSQLARNLEIAENLARGRRYAAVLIIENKDDFKPIDPASLTKSLKPLREIFP